MKDDTPPPGSGRVLRCGSEELCLRFVNTVAWRRSEAPEERMPTPAALLEWCAGAGLLAGGVEIAPADAPVLHRRAVGLREAAYEIFRSRIAGSAPPGDALREFNDILAALPPRTAIAPSGESFGWRIGPAGVAPLDVLAPIAWSAADLLTGPRAHRVRQCEDDRGCGWLFLDESRAGNRRWCSMGDCGNRAKARRHYLRRRR